MPQNSQPKAVRLIEPDSKEERVILMENAAMFLMYLVNHLGLGRQYSTRAPGASICDAKKFECLPTGEMESFLGVIPLGSPFIGDQCVTEYSENCGVIRAEARAMADTIRNHVSGHPWWAVWQFMPYEWDWKDGYCWHSIWDSPRAVGLRVKRKSEEITVEVKLYKVTPCA